MFRSVLGRAASVLDRAATRAVYVQAGRALARNRAERMGHAERMQALARVSDWYPADALDTFFRVRRSIDPREERVREGRRVRVVDVSWSSDPTTFQPEMQAKWNRFAFSHACHVRLHLDPERLRPVVLLVHGYLGGPYWLEERSWPLGWLRRIGLDLALFTLPFHGARGEPRRLAPPRFPSSDPRLTAEGLRQTIGDLEDLVGWLLRRGHPRVGIMGMSLGGYVTALAATAVTDLDFAIPVIPLVSIADFARDQGRLGATEEERAQQHAALERVHVLVSPLARPRRPSCKVHVVAGEADRITPIAHARRLAEHFGVQLETWPGGHLLQVGRGEAFRGIARALGRWGVIGPDS